MEEIILKQQEIIESLVNLNRQTLNLLSQYMSIEDYESALAKILQGDNK